MADEASRVVNSIPGHAGEWKIIDNPPVNFLRKSNMLPLPVPQRGGSIDEFREVINCPDEQAWTMIASWLVGALNPSMPCPLLVIHGEQGSAKSNLSRMCHALIDPSDAALRSLPKDTRDLAVAANIVASAKTKNNHNLLVGIAENPDYTVTRLESIAPEDVNDQTGKPEFLPFGLIGFKLEVAKVAEVDVTVWLSEPAPTDAKYFKYDPANGWYEYPHAEFSQDRRSVVLTITDGGFGDADGVANGVIVDPGGPGLMVRPPQPAAPAQAAAAPAPAGSGGGGCFISALNGNPKTLFLFTALLGILMMGVLAWRVALKMVK